MTDAAGDGGDVSHDQLAISHIEMVNDDEDSVSIPAAPLEYETQSNLSPRERTGKGE